MRTLILVLILFLIQNVHGQNNIAELKSLLETIEKTDSLKEKIKTAHFEKLDIIEVYVELERDIDFGYRHHRILIIPVSGSDLKLNFISKNGNMKTGWISEFQLDNNTHLNLKLFKSSPKLFTEYVFNHNKYYETNLDEREFKNQILDEYVVGFACGFSGKEISKESKKSIRYSNNKNSKKLNELLTSFSPELQTLGAIGLIKINKITDKQNVIIDHLKKRNSIIFSCSGCVYGSGETFNEGIKYYEDKMPVDNKAPE